MSFLQNCLRKYLCLFLETKLLENTLGKERSWRLRGKKEKHSTVIFFFPLQTSDLQCLGSILLSAIFFLLLFLQENFSMNFVITCEAQELPWFPPAHTVPVPCPFGTAPLCFVSWIASWIMSFCRGCWWEWVGLGLVGSCQWTQSHQLGQPWNSLMRCQLC